MRYLFLHVPYGSNILNMLLYDVRDMFQTIFNILTKKMMYNEISLNSPIDLISINFNKNSQTLQERIDFKKNVNQRYKQLTGKGNLPK